MTGSVCVCEVLNWKVMKSIQPNAAGSVQEAAEGEKKKKKAEKFISIKHKNIAS